MPSGATHDRITLWTLPVVTGITLGISGSSEFTLAVAGSFLFGGLMLSPDLDLRSRPYQRWGWLRWIWIPYQKSLHHRSFLSHGFLIGTLVRVGYLVFWIAGAGVMAVLIAKQVFPGIPSWLELGEQVRRILFEYRVLGLALLIGLELGAISHIVGDGLGSSYKRWQKYGWQGLWEKRPTRKVLARRSVPPRKRRR